MRTRFPSDDSGVSAVEFAIVLPILCFVVLAIVDGWSYASAVLKQRAAVKAAANYVLGGGATGATAEVVALSAWVNKPGDASVTATQASYCDGAAAACDVICDVSQKAPAAYLRMDSVGTWVPPAPFRHVLEQRTITESQVIRVR